MQQVDDQIQVAKHAGGFALVIPGDDNYDTEWHIHFDECGNEIYSYLQRWGKNEIHPVTEMVESFMSCPRIVSFDHGDTIVLVAELPDNHKLYHRVVRSLSDYGYGEIKWFTVDDEIHRQTYRAMIAWANNENYETTHPIAKAAVEELTKILGIKRRIRYSERHEFLHAGIGSLLDDWGYRATRKIVV